MCLSINRCGTSCVTCCTVLLEPQLPDIMIVQFRNEKVSNHGSTDHSPRLVTLWPSSFLKKDSTSPQSAPNSRFSRCNGVSTYTCELASLKCGSFVFVDVAIPTRSALHHKQNSLMKIGNNGNRFDWPIR
ncbi:hypothetical protein TNCV_2764071 [Trichonephila clavipes]|nr:hypothetical protein TNCV_2764071 [Trichonephila clavipes]